MTNNHQKQKQSKVDRGRVVSVEEKNSYWSEWGHIINKMIQGKWSIQ